MNKFRKYEPISYVYFLNMELSDGGGGKEIITQNTKLKTVTSRWPSGVRSNAEFVMPTMK